MNEHWTRWIHASISKFFKDLAKTRIPNFYVEAEVKAPDNLQDKVELRWDGPIANQRTASQWDLTVEINILIGSNTGRTDAFQHKRIVGFVQSMFKSAIPIFKLGNLTGIDDGTLLGCLQLRSDDREAVVTSYFGKLGPDVGTEQSTVEAHYKTSLRS